MILENYLQGVNELREEIIEENFDEHYSYVYYLNMFNYLVARTTKSDLFLNDRLWHDMVLTEIDNYSIFFEWTTEQKDKLIGYLDVAYLGLD